MKNLVPVFLVFLFLTSCGEMGLKATYPGTVTSQMQSEFNQIESLYQSKNYEQALAGYQAFILNYEYNQLTDEAFYKQGKIFFIQNRFSEASGKFLDLAQKTPSATYKAKAFHMAGYSLFKLEQFDQALTQLKKVKDEALPTKLRLQYYSLVIDAAKKTSDTESFGDQALLKLYNLYEGSGDVSIRQTLGPNVVTYADIQNRVDTWLNTPREVSTLTTWMKKFPNSPAKPYVDFKIGMTYYNAKMNDKARNAFSQFLIHNPKHVLAPKAKKLVDELGGPLAQQTTQKADYKLGVLITQTESGNALLNGVRCAVGDGNTCGPTSGVELVVRDAGENSETLRLAIQDLEKQNVAAIVAIPSKDLVVETAAAASEQKIPIFLVSQKEGIMNQSDYVFQVAMQAKQQVGALVQAAISQGHKRFGVFYPNISYGQTMAELFSEEVKSRGAQIVASVEYSRDSIDVYSQVRNLKDRLANSAGIDALFIPDSFKVVNDLVPALDYSGIKGVSLLGTNAWNDPALSLAIAEKFPGSFFVDFYNTNSNTPTATDFKQRFASSFGRAPRVLEAYGFDATMIIHDAVLDGGKNSVKDSVLNAGGHNGVTGIKGFRAGEGAIIDPVVMKIRSSGIGE